MQREDQPSEAEENMQLINEVPLEEEEGESQDVTQSRKVHQHMYQQQDQAEGEGQEAEYEFVGDEAADQAHPLPQELIQNLSLEQLH